MRDDKVQVTLSAPDESKNGAGRTSSEYLEALVARAARGDRAGQQELLERYRYFIRRAVRERMGEALRAKEATVDLEQDVALAIIRSLAGQRWQGRAAFMGWLRQVARGEVIDTARYHQAARRESAREAPLDEGRAVPARAPEPSPESRIDLQRQVQALERLLDALPAHQAQAVVLFYQGHSHAEIGLVLGCTAEAARKHVARGRAKLAGMQPST